MFNKLVSMIGSKVVSEERRFDIDGNPRTTIFFDNGDYISDNIDTRLSLLGAELDSIRINSRLFTLYFYIDGSIYSGSVSRGSLEKTLGVNDGSES